MEPKLPHTRLQRSRLLPSPPTTFPPPSLPSPPHRQEILLSVVDSDKSMSAVQSHIHTGTANNQFAFTDTVDQHNKLFPQRQSDLQRPMNPPQHGGTVPGQASLLNLYGGPQLSQQQQAFQPQIAPQQHHPQQPQGGHPGLGMMSNNQGLVANNGGQPAMQHQMQHQNQLQQNHQPQRVLMQQRALGPAPGIMSNPSAAMQQGMFPPGATSQMRRISAQPQPHPQGAPQMGMGMQIPQQTQSGMGMMAIPQSIAGQLRQGGPNARMLANHGPPHHPDMAQVMAMGRQPSQTHQQPQPQQSMMNGLQPGQHPRTVSGGPMGGPPHPMPVQSQQQVQPQQQPHRTPFQPQGPLPAHQSHSSSPTRPPSHHSQAGTPGNPINATTPAQPPIRPQQTSPENMFMNLQQQPQNIFSGSGNQPQQSQRPPPGGTAFPFLPDSAPGNHTETPGSLNAGPSNPSAPAQSRQQQQPPFLITPAQQLQQLQQQQGGQEPFAHVIPHTGNAHHPHRMASVPASSPHAASGPSRVEAQSQAGPSRTPRPPSQHSTQQPLVRPPPPQGTSHVQPILPATSPHHRRTSLGLPTQVPPPPSQPPTGATTPHEGSPTTAAPPIPRAPPLPHPNVLGAGQGLLRLLGFSAAMANEKCDRLKYDHWNKVVNDYFAPQAMWKLTLWKDNERREAKPFEIGPNVIAMLLLVSSQSGVKSMNLVLDGARERTLVLGTSIIECPDAQWIWRFYDGHVVILRGVFACQISAFHNRNASGDQPVYTLKFDSMNFDSNAHDKLINLDAIRGIRTTENLQKSAATPEAGSSSSTGSGGNGGGNIKLEENADRQFEPDPRVVIDHATLPQEPINAFGIPQASMRCLELAESVGQMTELFYFGWSRGLGATEALATMGDILQQQYGMTTVSTMPHGEGTTAVSLFNNTSPIATNTTAHPPPTQAVQPPGQGQGPTQAGPSRSPQNQPPQAAAPSSKPGPPSTGVSAPSLKRKAPQPDPSGPAQADSQPPAKRITRRKSKAGGGG